MKFIIERASGRKVDLSNCETETKTKTIRAPVGYSGIARIPIIYGEREIQEEFSTINIDTLDELMDMVEKCRSVGGHGLIIDKTSDGEPIITIYDDYIE